MALGPGIEQHMDNFDELIAELKEYARMGITMPLDQLIESFLPKEGDCPREHCVMLAASLGIAITKLVLTAADRVH